MKCLPFKWKPMETAELVERYPFLRGEPSHSYLHQRSGDESTVSDEITHNGDEDSYKAQNSEMFEDSDGSLNWNEVLPNIVVGSCPRTPQDVDRLMDEIAPNAILNLQSDVCLTNLKIPFASIRKRSVECGIYLERIPMNSNDQGDQVFMLPEAVRMLNMLLARGFKVYVHCTSGLAHSALVLIGFLTFLQGMSFEDALNQVKFAHKVSDFFFFNCWSEARRRLLEGRKGEIQSAARGVFESRNGVSPPVGLRAEYEAAQKHVIATTFGRWLELDLGIIQTELDLLNSRFAFTIRKATAEFSKDFSVGEGNHSHSGTTQARAFGKTSPKATPEEATNKEHESISRMDKTESVSQSGESFSLSGSSDEGILLPECSGRTQESNHTCIHGSWN